MNKFYFFSVVIFFLFLFKSNLVSSQDIKGYGFKIGTNISGFSIDSDLDVNKPEDKIGYQIAVFYQTEFYKSLGLLFQFEYASRGFKQTNTFKELGGAPPGYSENDEVTLTSRLNYITFLGAPKLSVFRSNTGFLYIGPHIDYLISYKRGQFKTENSIRTSTTADKITNFSWGLSAGTSFRVFNFKSNNIGLDIKYNIDITDSYESDVFDISMKKRALDLTVTYHF